MPSDLIRDRTGAAPYVTPFLDALDRMQERPVVRPDRLTERARSLLVDRFGADGARPDAAFAHGATGLLGDHTHYFDGFALLMSLPLGTAVALRPTSAPESRVVFEGSSESWALDMTDDSAGETPSWVCLVLSVIREIARSVEQVEVAVVSTVPSSCFDAYVGALGAAASRASQSVFAVPEETAVVHALVRRSIERCTENPFGIGYVMAADTGRPGRLTLIDTHTLEYLSVEAPSHEELGWGLIDVGMGPLRDPAFHKKKEEMAAEAADVLRKRGFPSLLSLRDLEHKDLKAALDALPRRLRPAVRHLVTENRRVQKLVTAVRRRDWQMFGALLLMSHASLQKDWESTNEIVDVVVKEAEEMSLEGMYGSCMSGRGGSVLVVGQPFIVPRCLDRVQEALREQFDIDPVVMLL